MKKINRRDRLKIYGDLLSLLDAEHNNENIILTKIQVKTNVPFDRLMNYLDELNSLGLIQNEKTLRLTDKGKQYLIEYENVLDFMHRMGITY